MHLSISLENSRLFFERFNRGQSYLLHLQVVAESSPDVMQLGLAAIKHWVGGGEKGWAGWGARSLWGCVLRSPAPGVEGWIYGFREKIEGTKKCLACRERDFMWGKTQTFPFLQVTNCAERGGGFQCCPLGSACCLLSDWVGGKEHEEGAQAQSCAVFVRSPLERERRQGAGSYRAG